MTGYAEFLAGKRRLPPSSGIPCTAEEVHTGLFDFQRHIVAWAVRRGRAAAWADTGLGKSRMQVEWATQVIADNVRDKERRAASITDGLVAAIAAENRAELFAGTSKGDDFEPHRPIRIPAWLTTEDTAA